MTINAPASRKVRWSFVLCYNLCVAYLLIDGENLKGKIKAVCAESLQIKHPDWSTFDYISLFTQALSTYNIEKVIFYIAKIRVHHQSEEKSLALIQEQRLLKTALESIGYEVIMSGSLRGHTDTTGKMIFKEKGVDVRIAVDMISFACDKATNEIILCSSDSDLQPAIKETMKRDVAVIYLGFESNPNKGMTYTTKKTILIRNAEVYNSLKCN